MSEFDSHEQRSHNRQPPSITDEYRRKSRCLLQFFSLDFLFPTIIPFEECNKMAYQKCTGWTVKSVYIIEVKFQKKMAYNAIYQKIIELLTKQIL
jgi:hypothetical protein